MTFSPLLARRDAWLQLWSGETKDEPVTLPKPMFICSIFIVLFKTSKINVKWHHSFKCKSPPLYRHTQNLFVHMQTNRPVIVNCVLQ